LLVVPVLYLWSIFDKKYIHPSEIKYENSKNEMLKQILYKLNGN